jgi:hypothetical protein
VSGPAAAALIVATPREPAEDPPRPVGEAPADAKPFVFDDVPPGSYDLELRVDETHARWLSGVSPGTREETWFDVSRRPVEAASAIAVTSR